MLLCLSLIAIALYLWGAWEVRGHLEEIGGLTILGGVWLLAARSAFAWLGLSVHDDALERNNRAAFIAICGGILGITFIFTGGNLGEGPTYWNNVFSAAVGTAGLFALWLVMEMGAHVSASISVERDLASGLRMGAFLTSVGLMFGRALAGDWHSMTGTIHDFFRDGWPALVLLGSAIYIEHRIRPSILCPFPNWGVCGLIPSICYLVFALLWIWHLGAWEGMPR